MLLAAAVTVPVVMSGGPAATGAAAVGHDRAGKRSPGGLLARVDHVVDGDTIAVRVGGREERVRLIGIDTPETKRPGTPIECGGPDASRSMRRLLHAGEPVRLVRDPTQDRRDRYGRLLRYVTSRGRDVGLAQIHRGWAAVYVYAHAPARRVPRYRRAAAHARGTDRGVWKTCAGRFHTLTHGRAETRQPDGSDTPGGGHRCDPNYEGACLDPDAEDYDCAGGGGNGPRYVGPVRVVGDDHFGLDADGDGSAC